MGLKADIDEVLASWEKSPWWIKAWLALSAFIAVSSIASLAEAIVKWKGFFKDAIEFYKSSIAAPLREALSVINIHIDPVRTEILVFLIVFGMILLRYFYLTEHKTNKKWKSRLLLLTLMIAILTAQYIYRANGNTEPINWIKNIAALLGGAVVAPLALKFEKPAVYFGQWFLIISMVALMAAINVGLSK